jgi:hypothetical protein
LASHLSARERQVLGALILPPEAGPAETTVERVAARTGLPAPAVDRTLRGLEGLTPTPVHRDVDAALGIEFWIALEQAIEDFERPIGPLDIVNAVKDNAMDFDDLVRQLGDRTEVEQALVEALRELWVVQPVAGYEDRSTDQPYLIATDAGRKALANSGAEAAE